MINENDLRKLIELRELYGKEASCFKDRLSEDNLSKELCSCIKAGFAYSRSIYNVLTKVLNVLSSDDKGNTEDSSDIKHYIECMPDGYLVDLGSENTLYMKLGQGFIDRFGTFRYHIDTVAKCPNIVSVRRIRDDTSGHIENLMTYQNTELVMDFSNKQG